MITMEDHQQLVSYTKSNLEMEVIELLRSQKGPSISIASLPLSYLHKYGKPLEAEGYLAENKRNGQTGCNLTKLLRSFQGIHVSIRPHGQHLVVLAKEEPPKDNYLDILSNHRSLSWSLGDHHQSSSTKIYLTFPPESSFTDADVYDYFNKIGDVQYVRFPCNQLERMYGFVAFVLPDTVTRILSRRNRHFICGARVLVKPYMDKSQLMHKKLLEKSGQQYNSYSQNLAVADSQFIHSMAILEQRIMMEQHQSQIAYINGYLNIDQDWIPSFYGAPKGMECQLNMSGDGSTSSTSNEDQQNGNIDIYNMWDSPSPFTFPK